MRVEFFQIKLADAPLTSHPQSLLCFSPPDVKNLGMLCRASGNDMSQCEIRFITSDWKRASARLHDTECARDTLPKTQTFKLHMSQNWLSQYTFLVLLSVIHQCTLFQWAKQISDKCYNFCLTPLISFVFPVSPEKWVVNVEWAVNAVSHQFYLREGSEWKSIQHC